MHWKCSNCQRYGHTKNFCHLQPRCVKCAGDHSTGQCPRKERSSDVRCVLCNGNHPVNYKGCAVYKDLQKNLSTPPTKTIHSSRSTTTNTAYPTWNHIRSNHKAKYVLSYPTRYWPIPTASWWNPQLKIPFENTVRSTQCDDKPTQLHDLQTPLMATSQPLITPYLQLALWISSTCSRTTTFSIQ
jgi:hypothetical protein